MTTKQEKQLCQTQWFHATLLRYLESLKNGIDVKFNLGSELDFGPSFYITPDFEQARKFINKQAEFVIQNRENPDELQHHFDFIYGVQTDDNPTQVLARFRQNEITKEEMLDEFRKPVTSKTNFQFPTT